MAIRSDRDKDTETEADAAGEESAPEPAALEPAAAAPLLDPMHPQPTAGGAGEGDDGGAAQLGAQRYVHAAFFMVGILVAYIAGKVLTATWNQLADWAPAARAVPQLVSFPEDERESYSLAAGAVVGVVMVFQLYRRPGIRRWADEVAAELSKVTWPNRETVINGTLVVVIASAIATFYVAILDRFWGFLTTLVYGT